MQYPEYQDITAWMLDPEARKIEQETIRESEELAKNDLAQDNNIYQLIRSK